MWPGEHWLLSFSAIAIGGDYLWRGIKKIRRKSDALGLGKLGDPGTPGPRYVVVLSPVQDAVGHVLEAHIVAGQSKQLGGDLGAASEILQQLGLNAVIHDSDMMGEKRLIVHSHLGRPYPMTKGEIPAHPIAFALEALGRALVGKEKRTPYKVACGRRLRQARIAVGYTVRTRFAEDMREPLDNVRKWENGDHLVPATFITEMWKRWQITHDWIYRGDPSGVPKKYYDGLLTEDPRLTDE